MELVSVVRQAVSRLTSTHCVCSNEHQTVFLGGGFQDHNNNAIAVGATLAHEMGHNLGMNHDDSSRCICSGDSCIMAAALR